MQAVKSKMIQLIKDQPDDSSFDDILKALAFQRMIERGLDDSSHDRSISNQEMQKKIESWQK